MKHRSSEAAFVHFVKCLRIVKAIKSFFEINKTALTRNFIVDCIFYEIGYFAFCMDTRIVTHRNDNSAEFMNTPT